MKTKYWGIFILVWSLLVLAAPLETSARPQSAFKLLTQDECRQMILSILKDQGHNMQNPTIELSDLPYDQDFPDFYNIETHDVDVNGNYPSLGSFAVDKRTGDVWDLIVCREYMSKSVTKLQQAIRKRLGITEDKYRKLRRPGPMCPRN
jgi:hypothetical protein